MQGLLFGLILVKQSKSNIFGHLACYLVLIHACDQPIKLCDTLGDVMELLLITAVLFRIKPLFSGKILLPRLVIIQHKIDLTLDVGKDNVLNSVNGNEVRGAVFLAKSRILPVGIPCYSLFTICRASLLDL